MNTINVIEIVAGVPRKIHAFPSGIDGLEQAKALFVKLAKEQDMDDGDPIFTDEDIEIGIANGNLDAFDDEWQIWLMTSA